MAQFPEKLYNILCDPSNHEAISWVGGKAFVVNDRRRLEVEVLPKYFRHAKLTSFQRQLSLYGIKRNSDEAYSHPMLLEGRPDLVHSMKRKSRVSKDSGEEDNTSGARDKEVEMSPDAGPLNNYSGTEQSVFAMSHTGSPSGGSQVGGGSYTHSPHVSAHTQHLGNLAALQQQYVAHTQAQAQQTIAHETLQLQNQAQYFHAQFGAQGVLNAMAGAYAHASLQRTASPIDGDFYNNNYYSQNGGTKAPQSQGGMAAPQLQLPGQVMPGGDASSSSSVMHQQQLLHQMQQTAQSILNGNGIPPPQSQHQHQEHFQRDPSMVNAVGPPMYGPPGWDDRAGAPPATMTNTSTSAYGSNLPEVMRPDSLGPADLDELSKPIHMQRAHSLAENPLPHTQSGDFDPESMHEMMMSDES